MNRYKVTKQLGDGTYGSVLKAVNRQTGEIVSTADLSLGFSYCIGDCHFFSGTYSIGPNCCFLSCTLLNSDCYQENEEKVLYMGRVHAAARNKGDNV